MTLWKSSLWKWAAGALLSLTVGFAGCSTSSDDAAASGGAAGSAAGGATSTGGATGNAGAAGSAGSGGVDIGGLEAPEMGLKVAFLGDQGIGFPSRAVLQLVISEGADFVMLLGDFDYDDDPDAWEQMLDEELGVDYPWFALVGNHDTEAWDMSPTGGEGYKAKIEKKLARMGTLDCDGDPGVKHACRHRGLHFVMSGIGLLGTDHEAYIRDQMGGSNHLWRICTWHLNQQDMQAGSKNDAVGWQAFQECQTAGAFVASGHEHSWSRTMTLEDIGNAANGHGAIGMPNLLELEPGRTFVMVNGAGGNGLRVYEASLHDDDSWWGNIYTRDYELRDGVGEMAFNLLDPGGVAFIEFGVDGDPRRARGYYKTMMGRVVDEFEITNAR